jgi:hypothetical protein
MKIGIRLRRALGSLIEFSERLKNSQREDLVNLSIMKEEKKECLKGRGREKLKITLSSLVD